MAGKLTVVSTPIGNMMDITIRALRALREADIIVAEDTRRTMKLLRFFHITGKQMISYGLHNQRKSIPMIINLLDQGKNLCLVTDSGTPAVADPGSLLIDECWKRKIQIDIMPGPSALTSAIALCGFDASRVLFVGFLPRDKRRRRLFRELKAENLLFIFFESASRITKTLTDALEIFGNCDIFIARELTKVFQHLYRGKISDAIEVFKETKGELTVAIYLKRRNEIEERA